MDLFFIGGVKNDDSMQLVIVADWSEYAGLAFLFHAKEMSKVLELHTVHQIGIIRNGISCQQQEQGERFSHRYFFHDLRGSEFHTHSEKFESGFIQYKCIEVVNTNIFFRKKSFTI